MKNKWFYLIYAISFLFLGFIWFSPSLFPEKKEISPIERAIKLLELEDEVILRSEPEKEIKKDKIWKNLDKLNTIITLIVGGVNTYFVVIHIKKKRKTRPKKIGRR